MSKTTLNRHVADHASGTKRRKRAVLYLRVSTPGQVHTDYDPEGISIPAQREAGKRKAESLDADIVTEFVEPGRTATSIDKRPAFQEMVAWVKQQKDIDYVIVYHFNRVFRNSVDAGMVKRDLKKVGARVVSTVLDMGDNPEAAMVEAIIHAVDQYQSEASGADIRYKMGQKVKNGGTVGQAKLGYLNVREPKPDGGEIRTIAVDPERGPLVAEGLELYATGQYTAPEVLNRMTAAGLRTRGTRRTPPGPVSPSLFYDMLSDRYYVGKVEHEGVEYTGRHQALITEKTYESIQQVLKLHGGGDIRHRRHHHWLKGLVWCHRCGKQLVIHQAKGNGGVYFYFFCTGRQNRTCDLPFLGIAKVEHAVEQHFAVVQLNEPVRASLQRQMEGTLRHELRTAEELKRRLSGRLKELDAQEDHVLEVLGDPGWPQEKLKARLAAVARERGAIEEQLADATSSLETGRQFFTLALELLTDPQGFYRRGNEQVKRAMTKLLFAKLHLGTERVEGHEASKAFRGFIELASSTDKDSGPIPKDGAAVERITEAGLLSACLSCHGLNRTAMVELRGFEPLTPTLPVWCATSCATAPLCLYKLPDAIEPTAGGSALPLRCLHVLHPHLWSLTPKWCPLSSRMRRGLIRNAAVSCSNAG